MNLLPGTVIGVSLSFFGRLFFLNAGTSTFMCEIILFFILRVFVVVCKLGPGAPEFCLFVWDPGLEFCIALCVLLHPVRSSGGCVCATSNHNRPKQTLLRPQHENENKLIGFCVQSKKQKR